MTAAYYFHFDVIQKILGAIRNKAEQVCLSLDLNLSEGAFLIENNDLVLDPDTRIDATALEGISGYKNKIFILRNQRLEPAEVRSDGYYKLVPEKGAPTLEINGIKMHRSRDIDPFTDARLKTQRVVSTGDTVLDTCGGLGYSAIFALKAGAERVLSTEKSPAVIALRNLNPWLTHYTDPRLEFFHADITREIDGFDTGRFHSVIHDPPRFTSATGDLYGKKFYTALYRVMAPHAKLFHYTGSPKKIKTKDTFIKNTVNRLENAGFTSVCFHDDLQGIYAEKHGR